MNNNANQDIVNLRQLLHSLPELSENEHQTASLLQKTLEKFDPDEVLTQLGEMKTGLCAVYRGKELGPTIVLRCELDALPIEETNTFSYRSQFCGISHKCGHDGHMATLVAVAKSLKERKNECGTIVLLFQPAEETGTGAKSIINDERFTNLRPDYIFGFHNIPQFPLGQILLKSHSFASASCGFIANLKGRTSHSSYPDNGVNPTEAVIELVSYVKSLASDKSGIFKDQVLAVLSSIQIGNVEHGPNFGTAPGEACVMGILRAYVEEDLDVLKRGLSEKLNELSSHSGLTADLSWYEEFPATFNDESSVNGIETLAKKNQWRYQVLKEPFRWSEDFGYYTKMYRGAFFGLGSGENHPQLHSNNYDYPDELIPIGANILRSIVDYYLLNAEDTKV